MQDLRSQLLRAGLIDKKAKQHADRQARSDDRRKGADNVAREQQERQVRFEEQRDERRDADRRRERQRQADRAAHEERYRLRDVVRQGAVRDGRRGRRRFYFVTRAGRIPFVEIAEELGLQLEAGRAAIVEVPLAKDEYEIVARATAERVWAAEPELVRFWNH
jgi:uncharacterized protein YaiL (DUF2058 family)